MNYSSLFLDVLVDKLYDLILLDDYYISDVNVNLIDSVLPESYEEEWNQLNDEEKYNLICDIRDNLTELFEQD